MALGIMYKAGVRQMTREMIDAMGDSPLERDMKEYWYSLHGEEAAAEDAPNPTDLARLEEFAKTPRDENSAFFRDTAGKAPWIGKKEWREGCVNGPLVFAAVVQANNALFKPGAGTSLPAVFVVSTDPRNARNVEYLECVANEIHEMKDPTNPVPDDMQELIQTLRTDRGYFCFKVGASTADDDATWCATYTFDDKAALPTGRIPDNEIVPFILTDAPVENQFIGLKLIPEKYYA